MTRALQTIFDRLSQLPEKEQDAVAALISDELNWDIKFEATQGKLSSLAAEAREEYKKGQTKPLDLK